MVLSMTNNCSFAVCLFMVSCISFCACSKQEKEEKKIFPLEESMVYNAVTDYDGNVYDAVRIGGKMWMTRNLLVTHYSDGTPIEEGTVYSDETAYYYHVQNNEAYDEEYGLLYNWVAAMGGSCGSASNPSGVQGICPDGWHLPSDAEWTQLTDSVSAFSGCMCGLADVTIAKSLASTKGWKSSSYTCAVGNAPISNNSTGFSAMPAGFFQATEAAFGTEALFWSTTECDTSGVWYRSFYYHAAIVRRYASYGLKNGFSIRCVRD